MYVDTHTHLTHAQFKDDIDDVIKRAINGGMGAIVCSGVNRPTNEEVLSLAKKYDIVKACLGLYPIDLLGLGPDEAGMTKQEGPIDLDKEFDFIKKHKDDMVGVGEVGMDFAWAGRDTETKQKENFLRIIEFTEKLKKPIVVHTRKAEKECIELLESSSIKKVLLHTFMAKKSLVKKAIDLGYYFSIPTLVVRDQQFQLMAETADLDRIFTETDAPWLGPKKEERNEPINVIKSVKKIAEIKKLNEEEVKEQIWKNYGRVFGK